MAYNDSGNLGVGAVYTLGGYTFQLRVQSSHEPGEPDVVSVFAICRGPDGTRETQAVDFPAGTTVEGWSVEANETEASVYAKVKYSALNPWDMPPFDSIVITENQYTQTRSNHFSQPVNAVKTDPGVRYIFTAASSSYTCDNDQGSINTASSYTYDGKTVYRMIAADNDYWTGPTYNLSMFFSWQIAWQMVYGSFEDSEGEALIARFAIDIRTADGGPDGDWDEPGSDGDPNKTLYVSVTGANGGSATGTPPEREAQERYGSGGAGGHGGGGGAGASTVIIYEFATSRARRVVQEAHTSGPGVGGPGGKGGRGGPGCILIFY